MTSKKIERLTSAGTTQSGRKFAALDFEYVKIDERKFEDLLVFASGFSRLVNFYNLENKVEGDWSEFLSDETVILATIIDADPPEIEKRFKHNLSKALLFKRKEKKLFYFRKCFREIYELAIRFQNWYYRLKAVESYNNENLAIKNEISNAISGKLINALQILIEQQQLINESLDEEDQILIDYSNFREIWTFSYSEPKEDIPGRKFPENAASIGSQLEKSFQAFFETLLYLKLKAPEYLEQSLRSDTHYPEVALFLAFLKLFQHAQGNINNITRRHLDFYYTTVLNQERKPAVKDKVYLKFLLYQTADISEIKSGTGFHAGEDNKGNEVKYFTDSPILVNKARIDKLRTIHIGRKHFNVQGQEKTYLKEILASDIDAKELARKPGDNRPKTLFATFGEPQDGKGSHEKTMHDAAIGFAVSSPVLFLKEGHREIFVKLEFSSDSFKSLQQKLNDLAFVEKNSRKEIFIKCFMEAFDIKFTAPEGWYTIDNYVVSEDETTSSLIIRFDVNESEPSIVKFDPEVHEGKLSGISPVVRFSLSHDSFIFPYSLLNDLILEEVEITVNVSNLKELVLFSNIGQLSPDNPFYPFGPMPNPGSYLLIGSNEAFRKNLDKLNVNIEWFDLPRSASGFFGHYQKYGINIDNASFEARLSILEGGRWKPVRGEQQKIKLFRSEGEPAVDRPKSKAALDAQTLIRNIDVSKLSQAPDYEGINKVLTYTNTTQRGFVKVELANPEFGFAHSVYPGVLSETAMKNSRVSFLNLKGKKTEKLPDPPYTPQIKDISLDYSSTAVISLKDRSRRVQEADPFRGSIFHIHPFGEELVYPDNSSQQTFLLPDYRFEGSLLLGFTNINPPQTVTMLFEMFDDYTISSEEDPPVIEWSFLANNKWLPLKPSRILRDDTNGFIKTGIIEIDLPYEINRNNSIMDASLFWVRASAVRNIDVTSKTVSVYTQVVTATLDPNYDTDSKHLHQPLPPFSVQRSVENIEGIESVIQPLPSFNGFPHEPEERFFTSVSERLRHKGRAIMPWDFERMILEEFPAVQKVACLPTMTSENLDAPGSVLIVVSPKENQQIQVTEPMASSELLYQVKTFIAGMMSPFLKLEVRNPAYERIKIICGVKFKDGYNYGFFLQKLNEELKKYLTKGNEKGSTTMNLGGKVNTSDILSFMRTLPYVDFITRFSMVQAARDFSGNWVLIDTAREGDSKSFLQATKPWSILVPSAEHQIMVLNEKLEERSLQAGIDSLELGSDFIIE